MSKQQTTEHRKALGMDVRAGHLLTSIQETMELYANFREEITDQMLYKVLSHRIECLVEARRWFRYALSYAPPGYLPLPPDIQTTRPPES